MNLPQEEEIRFPNCVWGWAGCSTHYNLSLFFLKIFNFQNNVTFLFLHKES